MENPTVTKAATPAIENYLKQIFMLAEESGGTVLTNDLSKSLRTTPATITSMLKKLAGKEFILYRKYYGVTLTAKGKAEALKIIRKHRLWERFLTEVLSFAWDEVHEIAEQLEHIQSEKLIDRIDRYLRYPQFDPHGDPIPDKNGIMKENKTIPLAALRKGSNAVMSGVTDHSDGFLKYLRSMGILPGNHITVKEMNGWDKSLKISIGKSSKIHFLSDGAAKNILVVKRN